MIAEIWGDGNITTTKSDRARITGSQTITQVVNKLTVQPHYSEVKLNVSTPKIVINPHWTGKFCVHTTTASMLWSRMSQKV